MRRILVQYACAVPLVLSFGCERVAAGDWVTVVEAPQKIFRYEAWAGGDASGRSVSIYGGSTAALFGDVRAPGLRLRSAAGYGTYAYTRPYAVNDRKAWQDFHGTMWSSDVLLGYQAHLGPWIVKAFAGASQETHVVRPRGHGLLAFDDENRVQGERLGFKGAIETWLNIDNWAFLQTETSWSAPFDAYGGRIRAGYRLTPALSGGLEASAHGNANHDAARAGAFLRFEWTAGEISGAFGAAGTDTEIHGGYASVGAMIRF